METEEAIAEFRKYWGNRTTLTDEERAVIDALNTEFGYVGIQEED